MTPLAFTALLVSIPAVAVGQVCTVVSVHDGDSLDLHCSEEQETIRIRLAQIDAPELQQEHGRKARDFLQFICPVGMNVRIQSRGQDRRKRTLGTVICNDINANVAMVMAGHAWASDWYVPAEKMHEIQEKARENHAGLWHRGNPVAPWDFRKMGRQAVGTQPADANGSI